MVFSTADPGQGFSADASLHFSGKKTTAEVGHSDEETHFEDSDEEEAGVDEVDADEFVEAPRLMKLTTCWMKQWTTLMIVSTPVPPLLISSNPHLQTAVWVCSALHHPPIPRQPNILSPESHKRPLCQTPYVYTPLLN